jgi:hypothetical protein
MYRQWYIVDKDRGIGVFLVVEQSKQVSSRCVNLRGAYWAIFRCNMSERAAILEACDMVDGFSSGTATVGDMAAGGIDLRSRADCC